MQGERWRVEARMMVDARPTTPLLIGTVSHFFLEKGVAFLPRVAQQLFIDRPPRFENPMIRKKRYVYLTIRALKCLVGNDR